MLLIFYIAIIPDFRSSLSSFMPPQAVQGEGNGLKIIKWQLFLYALSPLHSSLPFNIIDVFLWLSSLCIMTVHQRWRLFLFPYHLILQITLYLPESRSICRRNVRSAISSCVRDSGSIVYCTGSEVIGTFAPGLSKLVGFLGGLGVEYIGMGEDIACLKLMLSYH